MYQSIRTPFVVAVACLAIQFMGVQPCHADITKSGTIGSETWNDTTQPYVIDNLSEPLTIPVGETLTIASGVTVVSKYDNKGTFLVRGTLNATGATFTLKAHGDPAIPSPVVVDGGQATFDNCDLSVIRSGGNSADTTAMLVAKGASTLNLKGSRLTNTASPSEVNRGIWTQDTATLTITGSGAIRTEIGGFAEGILCESTTIASITDADFSDGTYGLRLDNLAVDLSVSDSSFTDFKNALEIPQADAVTLTNITIDQTGDIARQIGVNMTDYTSLTITGAISNMRIGVHVSTAHSGQDVSGVTFTNCMWDLLAEGNWNPGSRVVSTDTTLSVAHYHVDNPVTIQAGVTLTIPEGVVLDLMNVNESMFYVDGTLDAEGAVFQTLIDNYDTLILARNSGNVQLTDCQFDLTTDYMTPDYNYYDCEAIRAAGDSTVTVTGGDFLSGEFRQEGSDWSKPLGRMFSTTENGSVRIQESAAGRVTIDGFMAGGVHDSTKDLNLDGVNLLDCGTALDFGTVANAFVYNTTIENCPRGIYLDQIGVLVTNNVNCANSLDGISFSAWSQAINPQIGLAGVSFDENSYCRLPTGYVLTGDMTLPARPYRLSQDYDVPGDDYVEVVVPEGMTLTLSPGSKILGMAARDLFNVYGTLNATETIFDTVFYYNTEAIEFFGDATGTFTNCEFRGNANTSDWGYRKYFNLQGNSHVDWRGCLFDGIKTNDWDRWTNFAICLVDNATGTCESYGGTPCTFTEFYTAVWANHFKNLPTMDMDTSMEACSVGAQVNTDYDQVIDTDLTVSCPWLTLDQDHSISVAETGSMTFTPGGHIDFIDYRNPGFIFTDGLVCLEGTTMNVQTLSNYPTFVARNAGRLEFIDCRVDMTDTWTSWYWTRFVHVDNTATLFLDNNEFVSTDIGNNPTRYCIIGTGPDVRIETGDGGTNLFSGFDVAALQIRGLETIAGTPDLTFSGNARDIEIMGGHNLASDLTLPGGAHLEFVTNTGVTTIEAGATLTVSPSCWVGNNMNGDREKDTLLVKGTVSATDSLFTVRSSYYDDVEYLDGGDNGSDFMRFSVQSQGTFTNCRFEAHTVDGYWPYCGRIFSLEHQAVVDIAGGTFETPLLGGVHRMQTVAYLRGESVFNIGPYDDEGTVVAGFVDAIIANSEQAELHVTNGIFRGNNQGIWIQQFPAAHTISGNTFIGNETWAVNNEDDSTLDCRNNFWGHPAGPRHPDNPLGQGEPISGNILFLPYMAQGDVEVAAVTEHPVGQAPNAFAAPGDVTDAVLLRFSVGGTIEPSHCFGLDVRITGNDGVDDGALTAFRLVQDADGDGAESDGDSALAEGTADVPGNTISFTGEFDLNGDLLIVGSVAGLESGDTLSLGFSSDDVILSPAQFIGGDCSDAHHFLDRLILKDHPTGTFPNAFLAGAEQEEVTLFGCAFTPGYQIRSLDFTLSAIQGISSADMRNVRLLGDTDGNGTESFGETWYAAETVTISGTAGTIHFTFGDNPVPSDTSFVLQADFVQLHKDDTITLGANPASVDAGDGVVVKGGTRTSTHTVPPPLLVIDAPFQASNAFAATSMLNKALLFTFTLNPGGRQVQGLTFDLYNVFGIAPEDIQNATLTVDVNQNGRIDNTETTTVGGNGVMTVDTATGEGTLVFSGNFTTQGGDYILSADFADLENDDTMTITLTSEGVVVPANELVEGGVSPVRHAVFRPSLPEAALQTNWTLTYRSPGGLSVTGAYNHDDSEIILGYSSGTAFTFDADSNTPRTMFHKHFDKVKYAGFSNDDSQTITVTYDGAVYVWNAGTGEMENNLFSDLLVRYAVPSPDASKLFVVTEGKGLLLDMVTGAILWEFVVGTDASTQQLYAADYSPDGSKILVGCADKRAYLLNATNGQIIRYYQGHSQAVTGANFAANGAVIMTSSTDSTVSLFNIDDEVNPIATLTLDNQDALGSGISDDGSRLAIITNQSGTRRLRIFDDQGLELIPPATLPYTHFTGTFSSVEFNRAGDRVLICSNAGGDWNYPAALAVQYSAITGEFLGFVGPRGRMQGWHNDQTYERPRVSEDGSRIFYMHCEGLDIVFPESGKQIVEYPTLTNEESFDITPDGRKMVYVHHYGGGNDVLRFLTVDEDRLTLISENNVQGDFAPLTLSSTGGLTIYGDRMYRTLSGSEFTNSPNDDGGYRSAFSPDESLWGIAFYDDKSIKTMFVGDETGSLEYGVTLTDPYKPVKILYHPDGERVGCVDEYTGVQFYQLEDNTPVGLYDYRSGSGIPRLNDAVLSHDGTMLAVARGNSVKLFDMRTGRILRYFYPTHSGYSDCLAYSVGFGSRDNMFWIAWSDSYVEIFNRSTVTSLKLNPLTRTLPVGRHQEYNVKAVYDDGSSVDVTPEYVYRATGTELAPGARIYATPAEYATIEAGKVTINEGATGDILLTAVYTEGGRTVTAEATLSVGACSIVSLEADPDDVTLTPGVLLPIKYFASFTDGYSEEVTQDVTLTTDTPDRVRIAGNNISVLVGTDPGTIQIYGRYEYEGVERFATTDISIHGPESRWERDIVTPGGDTMAMQFSPDEQTLAVGSSSGAVTLYTVGATTTQYQVIDVLNAHFRPVTNLWFLDNETLITIGQDGRILQWDLNDISTPTAEFEHDAVITCAAVYQNSLAFGDNLGRVNHFDLPTNSMLWQQEQHSGETTAIAINATYIMSGAEDRRLALLNRTNGDEQRIYTAFARPPVDCWFDGAQMVVLSGDKRLARWDTGTEDDNLIELFFPNEPTALTFHNGRMYVGTTNNGANAVWVYDNNGLLIRWMDAPPAMGTISSLAITPDGQHVITGRASAMIEVENEETGETEEELSTFHSAQFWDLNRGSYSGSLAHSYSLNDARITEDGSLLFTQSARRVYRWQVRNSRANILDDNKFLETGYFTPYDFANLEVSGDAAGLVATRVRDSIYIMQAAERLLHASVHTDTTHFGLSPDGSKLITNATNTANCFARFWDLNVYPPAVTYENPRPAFATDVDYIDNTYSLGAIAEDMYIAIFNADGQSSSGITVLSPSTPPGEPEEGSGGELGSPILDNVTSSDNGNRVAVVVRYIEKDMMGKMTSHNYLQVYDISDIHSRGEAARIFDIALGSVEGAVPPVAVTLSDDGALLFYGMSIQDGEGHLHDLTTNRELLAFQPPSMGTLSNSGPAAAQFTDNDGALMIAWTEGYAEIYRREGLDNLRLSPAARSVAAGEDLDISSWVAYADGAEVDVTDRVELSVDPAELATISGNTVSISAGAPAGTVLTVTGSYQELGSTVEATSTLTVQDATFTHLSIDPPKISLARSQSVTVRVFAHFADASVIEVSEDASLVWGIQPASAVVRNANVITVSDVAQYGDVAISCRLLRDGDEREVSMALHIRHSGSMINPGDFDENLVVGYNDLIYFIGHYGETSSSPSWDSRCDFDADGDIDVDDAGTLIGLYGSDYRPATRGNEPTNLQVVSRSVDQGAKLWLQGSDDEIAVGESFDVSVFAQENHPDAQGFRGGPITILFDSDKLEYDGEFAPASVLAAPYNSFLTDGTLEPGRIERLAGFTINNGYGDGEPVLYAKLRFRSKAAGTADIEIVSSTSGLVLTPPVGKMTVTSTEFTGDSVAIIDFGGGAEMEINYDLIAGWNLIGIPLSAGAAREDTLEGLTFYQWVGLSYRVVKEVKPGFAYWVRSETAKRLTIRGFSVGSPGIKLNKGWNLITPLTASPPDFPAAIKSVYSWDPDEKLYREAYQQSSREEEKTYLPGEGFWILSTEDGVILWPAESTPEDPQR